MKVCRRISRAVSEGSQGPCGARMVDTGKPEPARHGQAARESRS